MNKLIIFCFVLILSCQNRESEKEFILKYGDSNFDFFKNTSIHIRGFDGNGNPIILFNYDNDGCEAPFIVKIDVNGLPIGLDDKLTKRNCISDTLRVLDQVKEYLKYNVCLLSVDDNGTVKVNVDEISTPDLIRVTDRSYLTKYQRENWQNIKGNWYIEN